MIDTKKAAPPKMKCDHCGDICKDEIITNEPLNFCCTGCQAVYELLNNHHLSEHYALAQKGTLGNSKVGLERKYEFLENEKIIRQLLRYHDDIQSSISLELPAIHCSSCIYLLEQLPILNPQIISSQINFIKKEIVIRFSNTISLKDVVLFLCYLGYEPFISIDKDKNTRRKKSSNGLGIQIAVAGFCFGNSMLISLPHYLDTDFLQEEVLVRIFSVLNMCFALPVVFFAAKDYFKHAFQGIKHGFLNINVPIALGILTLFLRSVYEIAFELGPGYIDSLCGLVFFLLLGKWYQSKTFQSLSFDRDYRSYFPITVHKIVGDNQQPTLINELGIGDHITLHNQELIPADGIITAGKSSIDYSFVTGEKERISKILGEQVFAGGKHYGSPLEIQLTRTVSTSELTSMWNSSEFEKSKQKPHELIIDRVSRYFTVVVLSIAMMTGLYWYIFDVSKMWETVAAVLIVACPCALALAMPFAYGHAMRILGIGGLYLKNSDVIEQLQKIRTIIFDKTGTLTTNDPQEVFFQSSELSLIEKKMIYSVVSNSAHPLSRIIKDYLNDQVDEVLPIENFNEEVGQGLIAEVDGCAVKIGSASWVGKRVNTTEQSSEVYVSINDKVIGRFVISTKYRPSIFNTLSELRKGFTLHLLSGDHSQEKAKLAPYFQQLKFQQSPEDKLQHVSSFKEDPVMMIGDGINDSGALKAADVGIAVCDDVHQFSPACDALIHSKSLTKLPKIISFANRVFRIVIFAFVLSFLYNLVGITFAVSGHLTPLISAILMPLSSISVVLFITIAVSWTGRKLSELLSPDKLD